MGNMGGGNIFSVFQEDPQDMPGQGLARTDNYKPVYASSQYTGLLGDVYGNQSYQLGQEQTYVPQWLNLNRQLSGQAQQNTIDLQGQAIPQLANQQAQADALSNAALFNRLATMGGAGLTAFNQINPQAGALYNSLLGQANQQVAMGAQLRPEDQYRISSGVRGDFANRGLGNSNAAQLSEAMSLYGAGEQTYQNRLGSAQQLGAAANSYYSPVYAALMGSSGLPGAALNTNAYAQQVLANAGGSLFNNQQQAQLLNNIYGQLQANNRTQAGLETQIGQQQAEIWNDWGKTATGASMGGGGSGGGGSKSYMSGNGSKAGSWNQSSFNGSGMTQGGWGSWGGGGGWGGF